MTTSTSQPNAGNRDETSSRMDTASASPAQTARPGQDQGAKRGQSASGRDEGSRSFRSSPESTVQGQGRESGNAAVLRCCDAIEENVGKLRAALSASGRESTSQVGERQGTPTERHGSTSGSQPSSAPRQVL